MTVQHSSGGVLLLIKIKISLTHNSPQEENFLGICKSVQLVTQYTMSVLSQAQHPITGFRDHKLLQVGLTQKLLFTSKELAQPSSC